MEENIQNEKKELLKPKNDVVFQWLFNQKNEKITWNKSNKRNKRIWNKWKIQETKNPQLVLTEEAEFIILELTGLNQEEINKL